MAFSSLSRSHFLLTALYVLICIAAGFESDYLNRELLESFEDESSSVPSRYTSAPEKFIVNLDLPEEDRWTHIVTLERYLSLLPELTQVFKSKIPEPDIFLPLVENFAANIDSRLKKPYAEELKGISKATNFSLGETVMANLLYDATAFCTSIVMQDVKGTIWHARNLDYPFTDLLRNLTIRVDFQRKNQTVYTGITYVGYIGLMTGQKPKAFTITANERDQGKWWMNLLVYLTQFDSASPISFLLRDTLEESIHYRAAVQKLAYTVTEAPVYYIIGGVNTTEGMVITKGREGPEDLWQLDLQSHRVFHPINSKFHLRTRKAKKEGEIRWFVVETNYDHYVAPPASDNRRVPAIKAMNLMGQNNVTVSNLLKVMSSVPVMNNHTTYTVVMSASQPDVLQSWVWHGYV